jgi:hypothetical protein
MCTCLLLLLPLLLLRPDRGAVWLLAVLSLRLLLLLRLLFRQLRQPLQKLLLCGWYLLCNGLETGHEVGLIPQPEPVLIDAPLLLIELHWPDAVWLLAAAVADANIGLWDTASKQTALFADCQLRLHLQQGAALPQVSNAQAHLSSWLLRRFLSALQPLVPSSVWGLAGVFT